jgi:hypothetical protein
MCHRDVEGELANNRMNLTALRAARYPGRSPHGDRIQCPRAARVHEHRRRPVDRRRRGEADRPPAACGRRPRRRCIGQPVAITRTIVSGVDVAADAGWQRQADRQRRVYSDRLETSRHRVTSRVGNLPWHHLRGVEPASRADAGSRRRRSEAGWPRRSPARSPHGDGF